MQSEKKFPVILILRRAIILLQGQKALENNPILEELKIMSTNKSKKNTALNNMKMQAASEVGVPLKDGYNGDLTAKQVGSVGGQMVKKMVESYENSAK